MKISVHKNVTRLIDYFDSSDYFYLVYELESWGTLTKYLYDHNQYL